MKRKMILFTSLTAVVTFSVATVIVLGHKQSVLSKGVESFHMILDSSVEPVEKDGGYFHEVDIKNNKIDIIGYHEENGAFGKISREKCGDFTYNGMVYNRSVINGFDSLTVDFTGGTLYYVFTDFLMEDMSFYGHLTLTSNQPVAVPEGKAYFIIYNNSETPITINSIDIKYDCDGSIDREMIFNKDSQKGGARSLSKRSDFLDSYVELENNPLINNNNYSTGSHNGYSDTWYRWNGRYLSKSANLGAEFSFGMTIMGDFSRVCDTSKVFHYAVWPQFNYEGSAENLNNTYVQTYIGNDNYEPLGAANALHPTDPYVQQSYTGRFFTDYGLYNSVWQFANPDTEFIADGVTTYRQAYEAFDLPFWFLKFDVRLTDDQPVCDVYINGFHLFTQDIFEHYDNATKPSIYIHSLPMHIVNYGVDADGTPDESYVGRFTYPRSIL